MNAVERPMADVSGNTRRIALITLSALGMIFVGGAITGFLVEHRDQGGGALDAAAIAVLAVLVMTIGALGFAVWRLAQGIRTSAEPMTRRETRSNRFLIGSAVVGLFAGMALVIAGDFGGGDPSPFSDAPIPAATAVALAALFAIGMPVLSWYWHMHVIDEQEAEAYRSGALIAAYAFWIVAPVWWLLWRGGLLPAVDGVAIYLGTIIIASIIWFWKKFV
jgi:hypothetical protein